jgi:acetyl-CoA carboxylase biotin carboxylase subunit
VDGYNLAARSLPLYDPLLAKICAWAPDRPQCVARLRRALRETKVRGMSTDLGELRASIDAVEFERGLHDSRGLPARAEVV